MARKKIQNRKSVAKRKRNSKRGETPFVIVQSVRTIEAIPLPGYQNS